MPGRAGARGGRAADDLYEFFSNAIQSGDLKEGQPLPTEREIVETHGVSRTVVREALSQLASRGLIDARPRFRPVVRRASFDAALETIETLIERLLARPEDVRHMYETRIVLEESLVRYAALNATDEELDRLKSALDLNGDNVEDNAEFFETDIAFHSVLYDIKRNPILKSINRGYMTWLAPQWSVMPRDEVRNRRNHIAHQAIYEAIRVRDPDRAAAELRAHLEDAWTQIEETFT